MKIVLTALTTTLLLTGCKEPDIIGEWSGDHNTFNAGAIISLFSDTKLKFTSEQITVSDLKRSGDTYIFYVKLGEARHTREWVDEALLKAERRRTPHKTHVNLTITDLPEETKVFDTVDLQSLARAGLLETGEHTASVNWENARIIVYTKALEGKYTNPYTFRSSTWCALKVPFTGSLPKVAGYLWIPKVTRDDIAQDPAYYGMTDLQIDEMVKNKNEIIDVFNDAFSAITVNYPHTITFSDSFMDLFVSKGGNQPMGKFSYAISEKELILYYGKMDGEYINNVLGRSFDYSGTKHHTCEKIITEKTPEIMNAKYHALRYNRLALLAINPDGEFGD